MHKIITSKNTRLLTVASAIGFGSVTSVFYQGLEVLRYDSSKRICVVKTLRDNTTLTRVNQGLRALGLPHRLYVGPARGASNLELVQAATIEIPTDTGSKTVEKVYFPEWNAPGAAAELKFSAVPVQGAAA